MGLGNSLVHKTVEQCKRHPHVPLLPILVALSPNCYNWTSVRSSCNVNFVLTVIIFLVQSYVIMSISEKLNIAHLISQIFRRNSLSKARHIPRLGILPLPPCWWDGLSFETFLSLNYTFCSRSLNSLLKLILKFSQNSNYPQVMYTSMLGFYSICLVINKLLQLM